MMKRFVLFFNAMPSLSRQIPPTFLAFSPHFSTKHPSSSHSQSLVPKFDTSSLSDGISESLARVPCHYIKTAQQMKRIGNHLNSVREFAFDMEHTLMYHKMQHTCLLQISTRREDFIIDILVPEVHNKMHLLKKPFENKGIVKLAHATNDVHWMQRDFGIQTASFVDTSLLNCELNNLISLDMLVCFSCGVRLYKQKSFIMNADWTKRPIDGKMLTYARLDSHFLLPAYDFFSREFAGVSMPAKAHGIMLARAFANLMYPLADAAARRFRDLYLPIWRQLIKEKDFHQ